MCLLVRSLVAALCLSIALPAAAGEDHRDAVNEVISWIADTGDNKGLPYIIVDKVNARLSLFNGVGVPEQTVDVLIGAARGDDSVPGIGTRKLALIRPGERTTPAGRFEAQLGHDSSGEDILWIDYATAIALHRATDRKPGHSARSRLERLNSGRVGDRRASFGCIGVATAFYENSVRPAFRTGGIVYILPETRTATAEFNIPAETETAAF